MTEDYSKLLLLPPGERSRVARLVREDEARWTIIDRFGRIVAGEEGAADNLSVRDLMEMAHIVWVQGGLTHIDGSPFAFGELADLLCRHTGRRLPANPRAAAARAAARKGVKCYSLLEREMRKVDLVAVARRYM